MLSRPVVLLLACLLLICLPARQAAAETVERTLVQVLIGAAEYDEQSLTFNNQTSGGTTSEDLSTMPVVGLIGQYPLSFGRTEVGVEGSALFGWRSRRTSIVSNLNQTHIRIEASFWMLDISGGVYVSRLLGERWRSYAAIGPTMLFADYSEDRTAEPDPLPAEDAADNGTTEFGVGGYARLGLEYQVTPDGYVGVCVRGVASNLEFDRPATGAEVSGVQGFVTFSRWF